MQEIQIKDALVILLMRHEQLGGHADIAKMINKTRETVTKELGKLKRQGLIEMSYGSVRWVGGKDVA